MGGFAASESKSEKSCKKKLLIISWQKAFLLKWKKKKKRKLLEAIEWEIGCLEGQGGWKHDQLRFEKSYTLVAGKLIIFG